MFLLKGISITVHKTKPLKSEKGYKGTKAKKKKNLETPPVFVEGPTLPNSKWKTKLHGKAYV